MEVVVIVGLVLLGLIFGSFANALVWRLHAQEEVRDKLTELKSKKHTPARARNIAKLQTELRTLSMSRGRSMCSHCHHPLATKDLIPLFSWLSLRGKCRYCREPIEDTPWLEALLPVAFVASYVWWPYDLGVWGGGTPFADHFFTQSAAMQQYGVLAFGFWLVFLVGFAVLTVYDFRWQLLPDRVVWPLVGLAVAQVLLHAVVFEGGTAALTEAFWGVVIDSGFFYVLYTISRGEWIGGGDVKLGIVLGLLAGGPLNALLVLFGASMFGTLASLPQLLQRRLNRKSAIPFGPFLMLAAALAVIFGQAITDWFNNFLLLG